MLVQTLKTSLKVMKDSLEDKGYHAKKRSRFRKDFELHAEEVKGTRQYKFLISTVGNCMTVCDSGICVTQEIKDIEMLQLPNYFKLTKYVETEYTANGGISSRAEFNISKEASFFVRLFLLMKERVYFTLMQKGKVKDCYYIDGKVFYVEEDETSYKLMGTDLYKMVELGSYSIFTVCSLLDQFSYSTFMETHEHTAKLLNKRFVKYRFGQEVS